MIAKINNCTLVCVVFFILLLTISSSSCRKHKEPVEKKVIQTENYICPMKCSDQVFHHPGVCPICKVQLEKADNG